MLTKKKKTIHIIPNISIQFGFRHFRIVKRGIMGTVLQDTLLLFCHIEEKWTVSEPGILVSILAVWILAFSTFSSATQLTVSTMNYGTSSELTSHVILISSAPLSSQIIIIISLHIALDPIIFGQALLAAQSVAMAEQSMSADEQQF